MGAGDPTQAQGQLSASSMSNGFNVLDKNVVIPKLRVSDINTGLRDLDSKVEKKFDYVNKQFHNLNKKFEDINKKIDMKFDRLILLIIGGVLLKGSYSRGRIASHQSPITTASTTKASMHTPQSPQPPTMLPCTTPQAQSRPAPMSVLQTSSIDDVSTRLFSFSFDPCHRPGNQATTMKPSQETEETNPTISTLQAVRRHPGLCREPITNFRRKSPH
ncbi:hypothetical protein L873DRAFT_1915212 [Choiromyces venosus 120613-1]|uniref:Uncharacterized protein n=1 Tax=Choiromyces venosus 120613-1 TaxID=1336337 RepID=A0A3N4JWY1_9PEZI|nr:hypothetical protein L873DRAFT_1915212 [Choiromyces venosus 120613-1]